MRKITNHHGSIMYLNSGDWIENLTSLEYNDGKWTIYKYDETEMQHETTTKKQKSRNSATMSFSITCCRNLI